MPLKNLEKIPWFAVVGALLILGMLLSANMPDFWLMTVPVLLTQALLYLCFGYAFMRGHIEQGFAVFLMSLVWLLMQIGLLAFAQSGILWFVCLIQIALAYLFFTGYKLKFAGSGRTTWTYAGLWVTFVYGLAKMWMSFSTGGTLASVPLWGLAIALLCFGYIIEPVEKSWAVPLQAIATLIALIAVFGAAGQGLQLLTP